MKKYVIEKDTLCCYTTSDINEMLFLREDVRALPEALPDGFCYIDEPEFILVNNVKNGLADISGWDNDKPLIKMKTEKELLSRQIYFENSGRQAALIAEADSFIQPMLGYAVSGILSDTEKETFKAWNEYRKALEDVDVAATNIEWPAKPE
ncbi:tail fiber assembly protein [Zymobacter palmae]|uniref:tail fiber assembly protein n=1 Tax=Zymobacter palmae TaxID=33074 RepID=UPI000684D7E1|nr:tail fiber assembly protein [Zymobacter palmae]